MKAAQTSTAEMKAEQIPMAEMKLMVKMMGCLRASSLVEMSVDMMVRMKDCL